MKVISPKHRSDDAYYGASKCNKKANYDLFKKKKNKSGKNKKHNKSKYDKSIDIFNSLYGKDSSRKVVNKKIKKKDRTKKVKSTLSDAVSILYGEIFG